MKINTDDGKITPLKEFKNCFINLSECSDVNSKEEGKQKACHLINKLKKELNPSKVFMKNYYDYSILIFPKEGYKLFGRPNFYAGDSLDRKYNIVLHNGEKEDYRDTYLATSKEEFYRIDKEVKDITFNQLFSHGDFTNYGEHIAYMDEPLGKSLMI